MDWIRFLPIYRLAYRVGWVLVVPKNQKGVCRCPLTIAKYMRRFVLGWKKLGLEHRLGSRIVTYADDLVICCRGGKTEEALSRMRESGMWRRSYGEATSAMRLIFSVRS